MKLTILVDNNTITDRYFVGEPGLSILIEDGQKRILFDTGYSDAFLLNAKRMNRPLYSLDYLVLSHGHLDHSWGLDALIRFFTEAQIENIPHKKPKLVAHPSVFATKTIGGIPEIGSILSQEKLARHFEFQLSNKPLWLTDRLVFLGEINRKMSFEGKNALGKRIDGSEEKPDTLIDDSALAFRSSNGLVVITGCSHAGICNIVEQAKTICDTERVFDIVGGFHLLNPSAEQLHGTQDYLKHIRPTVIHACHCTDLQSKIALAKISNLKEVGVGLRLEYE